jgi:hypothetical protein
MLVAFHSGAFALVVRSWDEHIALDRMLQHPAFLRLDDSKTILAFKPNYDDGRQALFYPDWLLGFNTILPADFSKRKIQNRIRKSIGRDSIQVLYFEDVEEMLGYVW